MFDINLDGLFMATSLNVYPDFEGQKILIQIMSEKGQSIGVELRGGLTATLKAQIDAITDARPEVLTWEGYTPLQQ